MLIKNLLIYPMLLNVLENIFKFFVDRRNYKYDNNLKEIIAIGKPVISIGALSAGGAGKTPFAIYLANLISNINKQPLVICRGYRRKIKGLTIVSDGTKIISDVMHSGDEPILIAKNTKSIVIANESKSDGAIYAEQNFDFDAIIIDDGFQHRRLKRDIDIVIIDKETIEKPFMFPRGLLREDFKALKRAQIVALINGAEANQAILQNINANTLIIKCVSSADNLINAYSDTPIIDFNQDCIALAGIAKPNRFFKSLKFIESKIKSKLIYSDHYLFKQKDISKIIEVCKEKSANTVICTEKDIVKLLDYKNSFLDNNITLAYLPISLKIIEGETEFKELILNSI